MSRSVLRLSTVRPAPGPTSPLRLAIAATLLAACVGTSRAADCPEPSSTAALPARSSSSTGSDLADLPIEFEADTVEGTRDGEMQLGGEVVISQGERRLKTRDAVYDPRDESFKVDQGVEYSDPDLVVKGAGAQVDREGGATFEDAQFDLRSVNGRGSAKRIRATAAGRLELDKVRYTTCPAGNEAWVLSASDIDISQSAGLGIGRGVRLDFMGVPLLYTPFISFPVANERKSGFLFPVVGNSSSSGSSLSVPWYWNIAPNYDATLTPTYFSKRGGKLDTEFRFLNAHGEGELQTQYLPDDLEFGDARSFVQFVNRTDFTDHLRLGADASNASDDDWFEDFGLGPEGTSVLYLNRTASVSYQDDHWLTVLRAQNFQTIADDSSDPNDPTDVGIPPLSRPHTILPQLWMRGAFPEQPFGLAMGMDLEAASFEHRFPVLGQGWRMDFAPEISMPLRGAGIYLEPAWSWRHTSYKLDNPVDLADDSLETRTPSRTASIFTVDGGLAFERASGSRRQRIATLEPRAKYLYVPYRWQDDLPVFDTAPADLNLVQLFRTNRYVGVDRLSEANQLAYGLTSRLLDADSGEQFLEATVGQIYYFDRRPDRLRVALPGEVLEDLDTSDIVGELDLRAYDDWNVSMGVQWDPNATRSEKGDVQLQYRPSYDRVMNVAYRFRRANNIEQVDGSFAWPIGKSWGAYARYVYSLQDKTSLDEFVGLEYRACCWRLRLVGRRYVSNRSGDRDTSILLQLELNGLSSVGVGADAFLERSIRGYSIAPPED